MKIIITKQPPDEARKQMGMMCWMATEGGRKCPQCGRYAKPETLGNLSFYTTGSVVARISMYGHLPGFGCNKSSPQNARRSAADCSRLADYLESPPPYRKHVTKDKLWLVMDAHGDSVLWSDQELAVDAAVEALNHMAGINAENDKSAATGGERKDRE